MGKLEFDAKLVTVDELPEMGSFVVGFSENAEGDGTALLLMRALRMTPEAKRGGLATYALSTDGGLTSYGGVLSLRLRERQLELHLNARSTEELGFERALIGFDEARRKDLVAGLRRIFPASDRPRTFDV
jgi:immunity protein 10 of polymorphic toxin system